MPQEAGACSHVIGIQGTAGSDDLSSYLANSKSALILLYTGSSMSKLNIEFIQQNLKANGTGYILGGTGAISELWRRLCLPSLSNNCPERPIMRPTWSFYRRQVMPPLTKT